MPAEISHPKAELLNAYAAGRLDARGHAAVESHVLACDSCWRSMSDLPDDPLVSLIRSTWSSGPDKAEVRPAIPPSAQADAADCIPAALANHPRYRPLERCGKGGMGVVFRAEHRLMEREVALKVIRPDLLRRPNAIERFRREVRAAASLTHPNVVPAYDAEEVDGVHFLAMEFVPGRDLAAEVNHRGPLPVAEACEYVRQAALGLAHAHERGMVHRDIKPQNLMLTPEGQVKILDFGLSKFASELASLKLGGGEAFVSSPDLTQASTTLGTPDYAAPEQTADPASADARADIYALGVTLSFLLTARPSLSKSALPSPSHKDSGDKLASTDVLHLDWPPRLRDVLRQMTAIRPEDRIQTAAEAAQALTQFIAEPIRATEGNRGMSSRRRAVLVGAILAFGLISVIIGGIKYFTLTRTGTVAIEAEFPDVRVIVESDDHQETVLDPLTRREANLPPGTYTVRLGGTSAGYVIVRPKGGTFSLGRGEMEPIEVRRIDPDQNEPTDPVAALRSLGAKIGRTNEGNIFVDVRGNPAFTDEKVSLITALPNVTDVTLESLPVTDAGLQRLRSLVGLHRLILNDSDVSGNVLQIVSQMPLRRTVSNLGLRGLPVGDDDLAPVGRLDSLYKIDLSGTKVTDAGLKHLVGTRLRVLDVRKTGVTPAGAAELQAAMPEIQILL